MSERKFRFGATAGPVTDADSWAETARRVESAGFDTLLLPDTLYTPAPLVALAAAAAVTTTLRVGTWVLCDSLRNPAMLAWEAATLDRLSDGRFELGLGAGRPDAERDAQVLGVPYGSPGERVQTTRGLGADDPAAARRGADPASRPRSSRGCRC